MEDRININGVEYIRRESCDLDEFELKERLLKILESKLEDETYCVYGEDLVIGSSDSENKLDVLNLYAILKRMCC